MLVRHLLAIAALPLVVVVVVPAWIARDQQTVIAIAHRPLLLALQAIGLLVLAVGFWLFAYSLAHFARRGHGTLAPWDPPTALVVSGPYRYVRNPMISGVLFILVAEALLFLSPAHATWALAFFALNAAYIPLLEEPRLELRFGDDYRRYCQHVGRLLPRLRPWNGEQELGAQ